MDLAQKRRRTEGSDAFKPIDLSRVRAESGAKAASSARAAAVANPAALARVRAAAAAKGVGASTAAAPSAKAEGGGKATGGSQGRVFQGETLLIRGLPRDVVEGDLRTCFKKQGVTVGRITVCLDPDTKRCKGYAFADLVDHVGGGRAMAEYSRGAIHGAEVKGRHVAAELYPPPGAGGRGANNGGSPPGKGGGPASPAGARREPAGPAGGHDYGAQGWYGKGGAGDAAWGSAGWGVSPGMWNPWWGTSPWGMMAKGGVGSGKGYWG